MRIYTLLSLDLSPKGREPTLKETMKNWNKKSFTFTLGKGDDNVEFVYLNCLCRC